MKLRDVLKDIKSDILEYESDTFSASGSGITQREACGVLAKLIKDNIQLGDNIDGLEITVALDEVRER